jgi:integrase
MAQRLTDKLIKSLPMPPHGNRIYYDGETAGFGCRVTAAGARSFVLNYRRKADGLERRATIGQWPAWSVTAARTEAQRLRRQVDGGADPVGEQRDQREAPTVGDLCDRVADEHLPRKRESTARDYRWILQNVIRPALGQRKVASLEFADIDKLHRQVTKERGAYQANRSLAVLSKMCSLAERWQWRTGNPCKGVPRNDEAKRKRYLSDVELARLTKALAEHDDRDAADIFRLLLLTGARRGEVLAARWADFDLRSGTWTKPGATTKTRTDHVVPLSGPARQMLAAREHTSEWVFPSRTGGHRVDVKSNWLRVCKAAKISGLRVHDLRHSFASQLASSGASLTLVGALLGHTNPITTSRYSHLFDEPQRAAVERVGAIIASKSATEIVPLGKRGRR